MKFHTPQWDDSEQVWITFRQENALHLESLRGRLPEQVLELAVLIGTGDGLIAEVRYEQALRLIRLVLRCGDRQMGYYDLILTYNEAKMQREDEMLLARLARNTIDERNFEADLCRQEIDIIAEGKIEHRLEFHVRRQPRCWFSIRCDTLLWKVISQPSRKLPVRSERFLRGPVT